MEIDTTYRKALAGISGIDCVQLPEQGGANYAYFPIRVSRDFPISRDALYEKLKSEGIYARRYFYPLISSFPMYRGLSSASVANLPMANQVASEIICLPIYPSLSIVEQNSIIKSIKMYVV